MVHVVVQGVQSTSLHVHIHRPIGALSHHPGPVQLSADSCELAELWLRYNNDKSLQLQKRFWVLSSACIVVVSAD